MKQTLKVLRPTPEEEAEINYKDIPKIKPETKLVHTSLEEMQADWRQWMAERKRKLRVES